MTDQPDREAMLMALRSHAEASLSRRQLVSELRASDLEQRMAVLSACEANSYQPSTTGAILPTGDHLQIQLREEVSRQIFLYGGYEETLTLAIMRALTPDSVFYDVGAHYGFFSVLASRFVGWRGTVVAFEPGRAAFAKLSINLAGRQNCRAVNKAVWHRTGPLTFNDAGDDQSAFSSVTQLRLPAEQRESATRAMEVEAISLDDFVRAGGPRPDVIKIDVESAESSVIRGAEEVLATCRPMLTVEVGDFEHLLKNGVPASRDVVQALVDRGYDLFETHLDGLRPHVPTAELYQYGNLVALPKNDPDGRFSALLAA